MFTIGRTEDGKGEFHGENARMENENFSISLQGQRRKSSIE